MSRFEDPRREQLARQIVYRRTGLPAHIASDEDWDAACAEADAVDLPPVEPPTPLAEAIRKARGNDPTGAELAEQIGALNKAAAVIRRACRGEDGGDDGDR